MKKQIRTNVFETNSSSVHSLTVFERSKYNEWKNGKYLFDIIRKIFVRNLENEIERYIDDELKNHYPNIGWVPSEDYIRNNLKSYDAFYDTSYGGDIEECDTPDGKWTAVSFYKEDY